MNQIVPFPSAPEKGGDRPPALHLFTAEALAFLQWCAEHGTDPCERTAYAYLVENQGRNILGCDRLLRVAFEVLKELQAMAPL